MIDRKWVGHAFPTVTWEIEKGRLRAFANAIGDLRPECHEEQAARAAGYRSLLAPPTLINSGPLDHGSTDLLLATIGVNIANILHGEQSFRYHAPVCAGDVLSYESTIADIAVKKNGAMELVTQETFIGNQLGSRVGHMRRVIVVMNK